MTADLRNVFSMVSSGHGAFEEPAAQRRVHFGGPLEEATLPPETAASPAADADLPGATQLQHSVLRMWQTQQELLSAAEAQRSRVLRAQEESTYWRQELRELQKQEAEGAECDDRGWPSELATSQTSTPPTACVNCSMRIADNMPEVPPLPSTPHSPQKRGRLKSSMSELLHLRQKMQLLVQEGAALAGPPAIPTPVPCHVRPLCTWLEW